MLKEESNWAQVCDSCRSAACTVYCHADSAYLCTSCDAQVHAVNRLASRHERVRVCQSCERAPAAFFCKADAASLCTACDSEIHSANPLARRHQRVPILPISGNSYGSMETNHSCETTVTDPENSMVLVGQEEEDRDEAEAASWLLPNLGKNSGINNNNSQNNGFSIGDEYLDLVDYSSSMDQSSQYQQHRNVPERSYREDGVVPLQVDESKSHHKHHEELNFELGITYAPPSSSNGFISHMVHVSSIDLGVVPESTTSDATVSHPRSPKAVTERIPEPPAQMLSPMERQARVMRYREKKKMRKFEKTIRYASRKAYAEKRPRIKGRFAKRKEVDAEADQAFSTTITFDTGYGIVPSL
ncbi:PREDICTED: zinc finger protein CONSTANS-LIKE 1-like [Camelina sativa]|uniref:Zinc finger protein CONSTANS-LIKE 1-like n=1 Tax=Camelina sativa TaxID=90675 RepID=A0ABM0XXJ8_CAMSA|nr:PREDICTED: zinc finger protein CONSTANS-LIKE 1-like [Camelina sativa]